MVFSVLQVVSGFFVDYSEIEIFKNNNSDGYRDVVNTMLSMILESVKCMSVLCGISIT